MKNKTKKVLPKTTPEMLSGTVHEQYVRCGKPNCKCSRGELHGAYYYHFVRVGGRLRKRYIKPDEVEQIRLACAHRQKEDKAEREYIREFWQVIRNSRTKLRELSKVR